MATRKKKNNIGAFGHPIYGKGFAKYGEMRTNGSSEIPNDLEEAARKYQESVPVDTRIHYCGADEDVYFANRIVDAVIVGAKLQKEQMMKEAVEGEIAKDNRGNNVVRAGVFNKDFEYGDKVRIVVLKAEE